MHAPFGGDKYLPLPVRATARKQRLERGANRPAPFTTKLLYHTFATRTTFPGVVDDSRAGTMQHRTSLFRAGQPAAVASASHAGVLGRGHRSVRRHHLPVHVASCEARVTHILLNRHRLPLARLLTGAHRATLTRRWRYRVRARRVAVQSRLGDHPGLASEDPARLVPLGPLRLRSMVHPVPRATFRKLFVTVQTAGERKKDREREREWRSRYRIHRKSSHPVAVRGRGAIEEFGEEKS